MAVNIDWGSDHPHIIRLDYSGDVSSDELRDAFRECENRVRSESERVDILVNTADMRQMPRNVLSLTATFIREAPENFGLLVLVGDNTYIGSLAMTFWRVYPFESARIALAPTLEGGYTAIAKARQGET